MKVYNSSELITRPIDRSGFDSDYAQKRLELVKHTLNKKAEHYEKITSITRPETGSESDKATAMMFQIEVNKEVAKILRQVATELKVEK